MSRKTAQVRIHRDTDIVKARSIARELALRVGFAGSEPVFFSTGRRGHSHESTQQRETDL